MRPMIVCLACVVLLVACSTASAQCGISQSQGLSPVVSGGNIQGCSIGQRINVQTPSNSLAASSLPPLQLNLPNPQAAAPAAPAPAQPAAQAPAPSQMEEADEEPAPQESRRPAKRPYNPNLIDERSLMALSTPTREQRRLTGTVVEHLVGKSAPSQNALTAAFKR